MKPGFVVVTDCETVDKPSGVLRGKHYADLISELNEGFNFEALVKVLLQFFDRKKAVPIEFGRSVEGSGQEHQVILRSKGWLYRTCGSRRL